MGALHPTHGLPVGLPHPDPPRSPASPGGVGAVKVRVQTAPFDAAAEVATLTARRTDIGAVVTFTGLVRGDADLIALTLEHYPAMTDARPCCDRRRGRAPLAADRRRRHPPRRATAARRGDRPRRRRQRAPRRGVRGGGIPDGLAQDEGPVLESRGARRGHDVGRGARERRRRGGALGPERRLTHGWPARGRWVAIVPILAPQKKDLSYTSLSDLDSRLIESSQGGCRSFSLSVGFHTAQRPGKGRSISCGRNVSANFRARSGIAAMHEPADLQQHRWPP